ncbi:MAG TPA: aminotransferase class I/II-fold pyridoxal phosphate-dependent enzyme [Thermomicrobiales bacterium]
MSQRTGRSRPLGVRTRAIHAGEVHDPTTAASAPNIVMASTFILPPAFVQANAGSSFGNPETLGEDLPNLYSRWSNPTVRQLEVKLASLEQAEDAVAFGSGMAASSALLLHKLKAGDHAVISDVAYVGVAEFAHDTLPNLGIAVTFVDTSELEEVAAAMRPTTKLVWIETPVNPILRLTDIAGVAEIAHRHGAEVAVDSTWATPIATRPLALGADCVVHSLTKYLCGHGDAMGGAVIGNGRAMNALRLDARVHLGGVLAPLNAWLINRGIDTLPLRMAAHAEGALAVARFLETHPEVTRVFYPGLPSHPQHALARRQMENASGMLAFRAEDGPRLAGIMAERLRIFHYAVSLGHQRSLIVYVATADVQAGSFRLDDEHLRRYRAYAGDGLFRVSVGLEDPADLCADLEDCLDLL